MRITIDNLDGLGAVDYSSAVSDHSPVTLIRSLNEPSRCRGELFLGGGAQVVPSRKARVCVSSDAGTVLFTGYLVVEPSLRFLGAGTTGPVYSVRLEAVSDEWLLDKQGDSLPTGTTSFFGVSPGVVAGGLAQAITAAGISVVQNGNPRAIGSFAASPGEGWSSNAAAAANASYSVYRALGDTVTITSAGSTTHVLQDGDGDIGLADLQVSQLRELANDVTLSGAEEPTTYVQETASGDGSTAVFPLSAAAYRGQTGALLLDSFEGAALNKALWTLTDPGNFLQLSAAGLSVAGGSGVDGTTTLAARNLVELGGSLVAELKGVVFTAGSDGMLTGFYNGPLVLANCFAGFRVRQSTSTTGGETVLIPVLQGQESGSTFTPQSGHRYTVRLRLYGFEVQRVPQRYYCMVDGTIQAFGSTDGTDTPMHAVFEIADEGLGSNTPATVLFDSAASGALQHVPAVCSYVLVSSTNLQVSVASVALRQTGSLWVLSTTTDGRSATRLIGNSGEGVDCMVDYGNEDGLSAKLTFLPGRTPQAGERITAFYRRTQRAVARLADPASILAEAAAGTGVSVPGVSRWMGKVVSPVARSSADCEAAAQAVLAMSTARTAAYAGTCTVFNPSQDVWPGDLLQVEQNGASILALVRSVALESLHAEPEVLQYRVAFANDWATQWEDGLGLKLSAGCASNTLLPASATTRPMQVLANLPQMTVLSLTGSAIQVDAGCDPPSGGGFEVRRRPESFGLSTSLGDLVLRSPVRSFSIPREAQLERYYVRMYDGSVAPLYSRFSSALYVSWPITL